MMKKVFKCFVALLAIAAAAAGPVRGQNASPDVTLDFTTNDWGLPTSGINRGPNSYSNGTYTITLYANNTYRLIGGYLTLGNNGSYLELPEFESAVDSIQVVGTNGGSANVKQNIYVGETAVSTQTTGATGTNTYVIAENYRAAGNIYTLRVENAFNTQITYIKVYYVSSGGGSTPAVPHTVRFASGNDGWTVTDVDSARSAVAPAVLQNVMAGDSLVVTAPATLPGKVKSVKAVKYVDPMTLPLTIEALSNGTITVQWAKSGMKYSVNGGSKESTTRNTNINVSAGDKVSFYGNGTSITNYFGTKITGSEGFTCKVYGNSMSLVDEENFATATTLTANNAFGNLFQNNTSLVDASNLMLPATTLAQQCYSGMFYGCSSLTAAPALPATTLKSGCYSLMFYGCRALIAAPALPATTLDQYCYSGMFSDCSALIAAPALPATTLANSCYNQMFYGCSSLTAAPALPATTLAQQCYYSMFQGCTSLTTAPVLPATTLAQQCYGSMFADDFSLTAAPALPATTLANECYYNMFYGCSGLTAAPALPATTLAPNCYQYMFQDCTGLTAAPALPATTLTNQCYNGMFYGCTGLTAAPVLPATTLADNCYSYMFQGCSNLSSVTCLATNISAYYCTDNWLTGVAATGTIITPSSTNWSTGASTEWPYGVSGIPDGWTRVDYVE